MIAAVLQAYGIDINECTVQPFGSGLINNTWKITRGEEGYILQRINHKIFTQPERIAANIHLIADYLKVHAPGYLFVAPIKTIAREEMFSRAGDGYFRLFPFVKNSHTIDVVTTPEQAFEAARQFGAFTKKLSAFKAAELNISLPDFHNLTLRYRQFEQALTTGNSQRINESSGIIALIKSYESIADEFEKIKKDSNFKIRVTHHDTKISNVLFDKNDKGLCVIDLDTIMPGYFISDVGDMLRTYLSPVNEEEKDLSAIEIRMEYFDAIVKGYLSEMNDELTEKEKGAFVYAGKFMIWMQALRFFTDYINDDIYYGAKYDEHNLMRAKNQLQLLKQLTEKERSVKL